MAKLISSVSALAFATIFIFLTCTNVFIRESQAASISKQDIPLNYRERIQHLRQLSKDAGLPQTKLDDEDVCFTQGCLDTSLELIKAINASVDPCHDFFQFSCGRWIANNPIPPTSFTSNHFSRLIRKVNNATEDILNEDVDPTDALPINQVKQYYKDCMDLQEIERVGLEPLKQLISQLGEWQLLNPQGWNSSAFDWLSLLAKTKLITLQSIIVSSYVSPNTKNTNEQIIFLDQPGFGLPRVILIDPERYAGLLSAYENFIVEVATELGSTQREEELRREAKAIIDFEVKLAKISASDEERYDMERGYNPYKLSEYQAETDAIDERGEFTISWKSYLDQVVSSSGVIIDEEEPLIVTEPEYFKKLLPILKEENENKTTLANYIVWRVVSGLVGETTEAMRDISFRFLQALTGATEPAKRETTCANMAKGYFGMAVSAKYIEAVFDRESKIEMNLMVENLREVFKEMVLEALWMEDVTKNNAIEKADAIRSFMAYPDWLGEKEALEGYYENLSLGEGHFDSQLKMVEYWSDRTLKNLRSPTDRDIWLLEPVEVNAMYLALFNTITFPAGILQPPFFGGDRPKHQNYGGIGSIIGHEITHGFDNRGSQFDKDGNAQNWWDPQTKLRFEERGKCMSDQYSGYFVKQANMSINGILTLPENIGDNGGLRQSFRAYRKYVEDKGEELRLPGLESFTTDQLFFVGYAQVWCEAVTTEGLVRQILTDPHSPSEFRVNGPVRNSDDFARAFSCPVDSDGMNPPAEEQCIVW